MPELVIVDSGSANLKSIYKASEMVSLKPVVSDNPEIIARAEAIIFPGVGSFDHAASVIVKKMLTPVLVKAIAEGKPFLGICLGMQLLFAYSEESRNLEKPSRGLNAIPGRVKLFPEDLPVPHVGWNMIKLLKNHPLFDNLDNAYFYFTHSYYVQPDQSKDTLALTDYGFPFTSAVARENLMGVQFHPEKSGRAGLRLLRNFGKIIADHH